MNRKYLFLVSDRMSYYTLKEISGLQNVRIVNKCLLSNNRFFDVVMRSYLSSGANRLCRLPFKKLLYDKVICFPELYGRPLTIVVSPPWYDEQLILYLRKKYLACRIILRCSDTIKRTIQNNSRLSFGILNKSFDDVVVYNKTDSERFGFSYYPMPYSAMDMSKIPVYGHSDIVFIGAAKDRLDKILEAYNKFMEAGLKCDFYLTGVSKKKRKQDGIVYADRGLSFQEYIAREKAADCLLEIIQQGTSGRTYRMMEAIIYNKKLITNCDEIRETPYYRPEYVHLFKEVGEIDPLFVKRCVGEVNYKYSGDFSPLRMLGFIDDLHESKNSD